MADYKIYKKDGALMIWRETFPRFSARIDWHHPTSVLQDIEREDAVMITDAGELVSFWARVMHDAGKWLAEQPECPLNVRGSENSRE